MKLTTKALTPSSATILRTRVTVSTDQNVLRKLLAHSIMQMKFLVSRSPRRSFMSKKHSKRATVRPRESEKLLNIRTQRRDATFMSKDSLTTSPKKNLNRFLNSMVRLRVWDSIQLIRRRNFTPLSALRSQMRPPLPKKSFITHNGMEELWPSTIMRLKNIVNFKMRQPKTSVASSNSAKLTPRALSGLTWPTRKSFNTTLSFSLRACQCSCSRREDFKEVKVVNQWVVANRDLIRVTNSHTARTKELAEDKEVEVWWIQWDSQ